jgi:hypothetical protein
MNSSDRSTQAKHTPGPKVQFSREGASNGVFTLEVVSGLARRKLLMRVSGNPLQLSILAKLVRYILRAKRGADKLTALAKVRVDFIAWQARAAIAKATGGAS